VTATAGEQIYFGQELEALGVEGFDEGDELPEEYRQLVTNIVLVQADIESELVFESSVMRTHIMSAPTPRARVQMARFYAEEINHGYIFWEMARGLGVELTADYFRAARRKRQEGFSKVGEVESWPEMAILNTLTDRNGVFVFRDMVDCSYRPWQRVARQVLSDEIGHAALGYRNLTGVVNDPGGRELAQRYLDKWYPLTLDMFGRSDSVRQWRYIAWGIRRSDNESVRRAFVAEVDPLLRGLGLEPPPYEQGRRFL
jgi:ring-1,2-phenylacetyl-CoA epoxidase subunit PaaA